MKWSSADEGEDERKDAYYYSIAVAVAAVASFLLLHWARPVKRDYACSSSWWWESGLSSEGCCLLNEEEGESTAHDPCSD